MKSRLILCTAIVLFSIRGFAQGSEVNYLGTLVKAGYANDVSYGPYDIGFNFTFFGNTYSQFYISTNGMITFGAGTVDPFEDPIPTADAPNNYIAAFWDDLTINSSGNILYTTIGASPTRKLIVQFRNMSFYSGPVYVGTFSIILYESSNNIQVQYRLLILPFSTQVHGESATIGIENADGNAGVQYAYHNPAAVNSGQAILFTPSGSTYNTDDNVLYDGSYLTTNLTLPEPGITTLLSPADDAVIGAAHRFEWEASSNATSYSLRIATNYNLSGATIIDAGNSLYYDVSGLALDNTYYWGVFATNATGTTWCEVKRFTTTSAPPLAAVPQIVLAEQYQDKIIKLNYTGGDASAKTSIITSLPVSGQLYQYNAGARGAQITSVLTNVTDPGKNVIYAATGSTGNGAGNFKFKMHDDTGDSPEAQITVNVSPPGMPILLYTGKTTAFVEMQFDRTMTDPSGKQDQFAVTVNGSPAAISSLSLKEGDPYTIIATLASSISLSDAVTIAYTAGNISATTGGLLASFNPQTVTLQAQTITFTQNLNKKFNESPFALTATAGSTLPMTYSSSNLAVVTISASTATLKALGSSDITARQAGDATWAPAKFIRTLTVTIGDQTITFNTLPIKLVGDPDFNPGATASSGLTVTYSSDNSSVATIVGGLIHIAGAGTANITASQAGNVNYNPAPDVIRPLTVELATGIENQLPSQNDFRIYTTLNILTIQTISDEWDGQTGSCRILNIVGQSVFDLRNVEFSKNSPFRVQSPETRGLYVVELRSGMKRYVVKVMVR